MCLYDFKVHTRIHIICIRIWLFSSTKEPIGLADPLFEIMYTRWYLLWNSGIVSTLPLKCTSIGKKFRVTKTSLKGRGRGQPPLYFGICGNFLFGSYFSITYFYRGGGGGQTSSKHFPSTSFFWPDPFSHMVRFYNSIIGGWLPMCPQLLANHKDSVCSTFPPS